MQQFPQVTAGLWGEWQGIEPHLHLTWLCREMAARFGVSLRDFDRANWQWSKDQSKTKKKECGGVGCVNCAGSGREREGSGLRI